MLNRRAVVLCLLSLLWMEVKGDIPKERLGNGMRVTVRAARCIVNETHCHCAMTAARPNEECLRPVESDIGKCFKAPCASGYKCDCASDDICKKMSTISYKAIEGANTEASIFGCERVERLVPKFISGRTTDVHIAAYEMFSIFRNNEQFGFGMTPEHKVFSTEIVAGDVFGIMASYHSGHSFGIKMRFRDLQDEVRMVDENWKCSDTFFSNWLQRDFDSDAYGWKSPSITDSVSSDSFDADVPWMWYDSHNTIYCRYILI